MANNQNDTFNNKTVHRMLTSYVYQQFLSTVNVKTKELTFNKDKDQCQKKPIFILKWNFVAMEALKKKKSPILIGYK